MPDASNWTGPWDADVTTSARGHEEINARLAEGWRIIWCSIKTEDLSEGGQSRRRLRAWRPLAMLGRKFDQAEGETERAVALQEAAEAGADALSDADPEVETEAEGDQDTAEPIPESVPPPSPRPIGAGPRKRPGRGKVKKGVGSFETEGIRG